ncbi:MAG: sigma-54-dependent Fis family transcriptional regulator [Acidocella sp. 20-61-6]|nr:MAG: sigma-54-dependent Fis family transcriptional regulator [Acidocella sp. 20-61-6]
MVGECPAMSAVFDRIRRFAQCDAPILISGETGTGKELAAQAVHQRSSRSGGLFIAINCAALPASLIASELFGYEKGAFTGAVGRKIGLIERANDGTLFLDEIADLSLDLQGHLLRFLQEQTITRIGGHTPVRVNARIISASHVQLENAVADGLFRDDLFYRLNVLPLHMPALRERDDDINLMAAFFLRKIATEFGREILGFTAEAQEAMRAYSWPGNVREMIAAIRRAVVMSAEPFITTSDLAIGPRRDAPKRATLPENKSTFKRLPPGSEEERAALQRALEKNQHNVTKAAAELGVSRVTFYRMIKRNSGE